MRWPFHYLKPFSSFPVSLGKDVTFRSHIPYSLLSFYFCCIFPYYWESNPRKVDKKSGVLEEISSVVFSSSVVYDVLDTMDCRKPGLPVYHQLPQLTQTHVHWVSDASNHLILCHPLLLPPSVFSRIRVFSNRSVLHIRWPKDWSFSFCFSPSNEYPALISFRMD